MVDCAPRNPWIPVAERIRHVGSRDNPTYREIRALAENKRARKESGRTLLDGPHLMQTASEAGASFGLLVATPEYAAGGMLDTWVARHPSADVLIIPQSLFKPLSPTQTPVGILAVVDVPLPRRVPVEFAVLLEDIQDPGNLGALLRCAAAAGVGAAHLSAGCAEAWSPKALRGGQGAQFLLDIHEGADLPDVARAFAGRAYAAVLGAEESLYGLDLTGACAFAFGNEGAGLSAELSALCRPFSIPMPGRVESLNVAVAAGICLFERVRQLHAEQCHGSAPAAPAGTDVLSRGI